MTKKIIATLSVGIVALFLTGCSLFGAGQAALEFNDKMIELQESTLPSAEAFGAEVGTALSSGDVSADLLNEAYTKVDKDFTSAFDQLKSIEVPDLEGAKEFHDAMLEFLNIEKDQVIDVYFKQILETMVDESMTIDQKSEEVIGIFDEIAVIEDPAFDDLQASQLKFAKTHDFELE